MAKNNPIAIRNEQEEYKQIRKDLTFVISLNLVFFAALVGLFLLNRTGKVDAFFSQLLKF